MSSQKYSFEGLQAWQKSKILAKNIYNVTLRFPDQERYGLVDQMRRAALSIASNLGEWSGRITKKDKAYFSTKAFGSLMELLNQLIIAHELDYIATTDYKNVRSIVDDTARLISALRRSQLR